MGLLFGGAGGTGGVPSRDDLRFQKRLATIAIVRRRIKKAERNSLRGGASVARNADGGGEKEQNERLGSDDGNSACESKHGSFASYSLKEFCSAAM